MTSPSADPSFVGPAGRADGDQIARTPTGLPGLDAVLYGGLPERSICVIGGRPGAGKTVLTHQILFNHLSEDCRALYMTTVAEPSIKMVRYMQSFDFSDKAKINRELRYLDIAESLREGGIERTMKDIAAALKEHRPKFVCVDSFKAIDRILGSPFDAGEFAHRMAVLLTTWDALGIFVGEYDPEDIRQPVFTIADAIVMLSTGHQAMYPQSYLEVKKLRGSNFEKGFHPYHIDQTGFSIFPRVRVTSEDVSYPTGQERVPSGIDRLDEMLVGGLQSGTATMIAGASGTGKTLLSLQFVMEAVRSGKRAVIASFQENPIHLEKIARGFGWEFAEWKQRGLLEHVFSSPVELQPDTHVHRLMQAVDAGPTDLLVIDSLKDLEPVRTDGSRFRDFLYSLVNRLKMKGITVLLTNEIPELFGPFQFSDYGVSFVTDTIVLLRYVEMAGKMSRAINVMKMRDSEHSKEIREFAITGDGLQVLDPITAYTGVMTGMPVARDEPNMRSLPGPSRFLVETLRRIGPSPASRLAQDTNLDPALIDVELSKLEQQGLVLVIRQEGTERIYRATI